MNRGMLSSGAVQRGLRGVFAAGVLLLALLQAGVCLSGELQEKSIDELWGHAQPPAVLPMEKVTVDPRKTALLILDIEELTCNAERRPRCLATVPRIAALAERAREAGMPVVYSLTTKGTPDTILEPVTPRKGEPIVQSSVDKFWKTDLERILADKGVDTVIVTGTAAHGAVLHTATAAGFRGLEVILPVDCLSAADLFTEKATILLLESGPATRKRLHVSKSDLIVIGR